MSKSWLYTKSKGPTVSMFLIIQAFDWPTPGATYGFRPLISSSYVSYVLIMLSMPWSASRRSTGAGRGPDVLWMSQSS